MQFDHPYKLLVNNLKDEYITKKGIFAELVQKTGDASAKSLFVKAKKSYLRYNII